MDTLTANAITGVTAVFIKDMNLLHGVQHMQDEAEKAFYTNNAKCYNCYEIAAELSEIFQVDAATELKYYLYVRNTPSPITNLPYAAIYAVNVYGIICGSKSLCSPKAIDSLCLMLTPSLQSA